MTEMRIGTSGWHYKHWIGPFYPEGTRAVDMLALYAKHFDTVELNTTFYRLPPVAGVEQWRSRSPAGFCFAAKGSRFITHMKKLKDPVPALARHFERVDHLGDKLGPIVFQLPPFWDLDLTRLQEFLEALPAGRRYAFEFRNQTWHTEEALRLLRRHNAAFCIFEIAGFISACPLTADFTYIRLHGPGGAYQGSYSDETLRIWASRIGAWKPDLRAVYVYFDNDQAGYAPSNALTLKRLVS
jgi:uncharacterized protein YecE (DUF72 family)